MPMTDEQDKDFEAAWTLIRESKGVRPVPDDYRLLAAVMAIITAAHLKGEIQEMEAMMMAVSAAYTLGSRARTTKGEIVYG